MECIDNIFYELPAQRFGSHHFVVQVGSGGTDEPHIILTPFLANRAGIRAAEPSRSIPEGGCLP